MAERFNAPVLKTGGRKPTRVRIPPPPLSKNVVFEPARSSKKSATRVRAERSESLTALAGDGVSREPTEDRRRRPQVNPAPSAIEERSVRTRALFEEERHAGSSRAVKGDPRVGGLDDIPRAERGSARSADRSSAEERHVLEELQVDRRAHRPEGGESRPLCLAHRQAGPWEGKRAREAGRGVGGVVTFRGTQRMREAQGSR